MTTIEQQRLDFKRFLRRAKYRGFSVVKDFVEKRDTERRNLVAPKLARIRQTANQIILAKERDGLSIRILTTYDSNKRGFSILGSFQILVVDPLVEGPKGILFYCQILRVGGFLDKAITMMEFLWDRLEKRPSDGEGLMKLKRYKGRYYVPYKWEGQDPANTESFFDKLPGHLEAFVKKWLERQSYYLRVVRKKRKYKKFMYQIRKRWPKRRKKKA